jgi:hypothetical protein
MELLGFYLMGYFLFLGGVAQEQPSIGWRQDLGIVVRALVWPVWLLNDVIGRAAEGMAERMEDDSDGRGRD